MMTANDFRIYDYTEGVTLELGDQVIYCDEDDEVHHIEVYDLDDLNTDFVGSGYCHDHDDTCYFNFGAFESVQLWTAD